jgi:hypothetical protein
MVFATTAWRAVACFGMYMLAVTAVGDDPSFAGGLTIVGAVYVFIVIISAGDAFADWIGTEMAVTTQRLLVKRYPIRPNAVNIASGAIEAATIEQTAIGHLLGYGTVTITDPSAHIDSLRYVTSPLMLRDAIGRIRQTTAQPAGDAPPHATEQDGPVIAAGGAEQELLTDAASPPTKQGGYAVVVGDGRYSVPVVGLTLFKVALARIINGRNKSDAGMYRAALLLPKPTSPGHLDVVVVYIGDQEVGYVAPDFSPEFLRALSSSGYSGAVCEASIVGNERRNGDRTAYDVWLNARFPFRLQSAAEWKRQSDQ